MNSFFLDNTESKATTDMETDFNQVKKIINLEHNAVVRE